MRQNVKKVIVNSGADCNIPKKIKFGGSHFLELEGTLSQVPRYYDVTTPATMTSLLPLL